MPTPQAALDYAKRFVGQLPVDDAAIKLRVLNDAHAKLWMAAPWRWTVESLEVVTVVNDQQEYDLEEHEDFLFLVSSKITDGESIHDLIPCSTLPVTNVFKGLPRQVQYVKGEPDKLRLFPVPTGYSNPPKILSVYKRKLTPLSEENIDEDYSNLGIPDEWFWVYQEIVLLKAMQFAHDPRLGGVTYSEGKAAYTGQHGVVEAVIDEMRRAEEKFFDSLGMVVTHE